MFIYKLFYEKQKNLQDIIVVQMYEIVNIQMHFQSNYLVHTHTHTHIMYKCVHLEKIFKNEVSFFHLDKI